VRRRAAANRGPDRIILELSEDRGGIGGCGGGGAVLDRLLLRMIPPQTGVRGGGSLVDLARHFYYKVTGCLGADVLQPLTMDSTPSPAWSMAAAAGVLPTPGQPQGDLF